MPQTTASDSAIPLDPAKVDASRRVLYALLRPVAKFARAVGAPLRELDAWAELACFHEARRAGLRMRDIAAVLDISMRKAALLSRRLKHNFLQPDEKVGLLRRIEFLLWAQPLSRARILRSLPDMSAEEIDAAIEELVRQRRIARVRRDRAELFARVQENSRLVSPELQKRLDALHNLLENVAAVVRARFVDQDERAFARTISFHIRPEDLGALRDEYERLWRAIVALEANARGERGAIAFDLSLLWAPSEAADPSVPIEDDP